jgi:hypothetical protein
MDDCLYDQIVKFYSTEEKDAKKYPQYIYNITNVDEKKNAKQRFRQSAKPYSLNQGILQHKMNGKTLEVLQRSRVHSVLQAFHDNPATGGHFGRDKTLSKLTERFYWKGMKQEVTEYIKACKKCFATNAKITHEAPPLHPVPVPQKVCITY